MGIVKQFQDQILLRAVPRIEGLADVYSVYISTLKIGKNHRMGQFRKKTYRGITIAILDHVIEKTNSPVLPPPPDSNKDNFAIKGGGP